MYSHIRIHCEQIMVKNAMGKTPGLGGGVLLLERAWFRVQKMNCCTLVPCSGKVTSSSGV